MSRRWALLALIVVACDDTEFPPRPLLEYEADWQGIEAFTLQACGNCHAGGVEPTLPDALADDLYRPDLDRNQPVGTCFSEMTSDEAAENSYLVVPCNPTASEFWRVLSDTDRRECDPESDDRSCDLVMPASGTIPEEDISFVRQWIGSGAPL